MNVRCYCNYFPSCDVIPVPATEPAVLGISNHASCRTLTGAVGPVPKTGATRHVGCLKLNLNS